MAEVQKNDLQQLEELAPINCSQLISNSESPCALFMFFRGKYIKVLSEKEHVPIDLLAKLNVFRIPQLYVSKLDVSKWEQWKKKRHAFLAESPAKNNSEKSKYGNKRGEYISYAQKNILYKDPENPKSQVEQKAQIFLRKIVSSHLLDWFFNQFHDPPDLFQHSARTCYLCLLFCSKLSQLSDKEILFLGISALVHEPEGNPSKSLETVVSMKTIDFLEKRKIPLPLEVINLIEQQDELYSGKGFPKNLAQDQISTGAKTFSIINHFDHYRLKFQGTRRARLTQTREAMEKRKADYDPTLWEEFWSFIDKEIEIL